MVSAVVSFTKLTNEKHRAVLLMLNLNEKQTESCKRVAVLKGFFSVKCRMGDQSVFLNFGGEQLVLCYLPILDSPQLT